MGKKARIKRLRAEQQKSNCCPYCAEQLDTHHINLPEYKRYYKCGTPYSLRCRGLNCRLSTIEDTLSFLTTVIEKIAPSEILEYAKTRKVEEEGQEVPMVPMPRVLRSST